jgi:signal transduction histidine kinase/ligand-binding sensor domain-containing protein
LQLGALTIEQGLSQGTVVAIAQDRRGFMWFATQDGLNRYDGYQFKVFKFNALDKFSLSNSDVLALHADSLSGQLWVGTNGGGLNCYNPATNTFTALTHHPGDEHTLSSNIVTALAPRRGGGLWIGTERGLDVMKPSPDGKGFVIERIHRAQGVLPEYINTVLADRNGIVWIGTNTALIRYNPVNGSWKRIAVGAVLPDATETTNETSVMALFQTRDGMLWIGTTNGLYAADMSATEYSAPQFTVYQHRLGQPRSLPTNFVHCIRETGDGKLWIGLRGNGLCILDRVSGQIVVVNEPFRSLLNSTKGLLNDVVRAIYEDRQGVIWIGTSGGGINIYNPYKYHFHTFRHDPENPNSLSNNIVWSLCEDSRGMLWVGTFNGGLNRYNPYGQQWTRFVHDEMNANSLSNNGVNAIVEDSAGRLWIGTNDGLNLLERSVRTEAQTVNAVRFKVFRHNPADSTSLSHNIIRHLYIDRSGTLWIATRGGGLNSARLVNGNLVCTRYRSSAVVAMPTNPNARPYSEHTTISHDNVAVVYEDKAGMIWAGTWGGGLNCFDRRTNKWRVYMYNPAQPASIASNFIRAIYEASDGRLYIGTSGSGLSILDRNLQTFTSLQEKDGLPNNVVYGIVEDGKQNLWMSTNKGLVRYTPTTGTLRCYTTQDGLQSNEFNTNAYLRTASGRVYFGGMQGLNMFHPDSDNVREHRYMPPIVLTDFKKFNRPVFMDSSISEISTIELGPNDSFFSVEFAALNFAAPEKTQYRYKLDGFDKEWIDALGKREAPYTNLNGGTYYFRVKASNEDGGWYETMMPLRIIVHPPWWATWWFRGIVIALCGVTGVGWFRWRTRSIRRQNELLERKVEQRTHELSESNAEVQRQLAILDEQARTIELANAELHMVNSWMEEKNAELASLNNEKNEILGIVAHDLKNPLSNIRLLAKMLHSDAPEMKPEEVQDFANDIQHSAERMFELITNLLNINQIEQGGMRLEMVPFDMASVVRELYHNYESVAEAKRIRIHAQIAPESLLVYADRNATLQVVDNILSNAIKYSPFGATVTIRACSKASESRIRVEVQDEGPGFSADDMSKMFGKFARLSARPTAGEHSTGLGLSIVKKLVEAMKGEVWCESELGKGATFIVQLPLYQHPE